MSDVIYKINEDVKLMFKTVVGFNTYGVSSKYVSNYQEYIINDNPNGNTMIKRTFSYYLYIDNRVLNDKLYIYPENMIPLITVMDRIKNLWIDNGMNTVYGCVDNNRLTLMSGNEFIVRLPFDKILKFKPGILKTELLDMPCIELYLNVNDPVILTFEVFTGLYYIISRLDMLGYANTAFSYIMLQNEHINTNRPGTTNISSPQKRQSQVEEMGATGRTFNGDKYKKSLLDD